MSTKPQSKMESTQPCPMPAAGTLSKDQLSSGHSMTATTRPPKPRKRAANAAGQNGAGQAFFFVDSDSSTREKRAHVMRHHIQTKRKQHHLTTQSDRQSSRGPRYLPWRKKSDSDATSSGEQDDGPAPSRSKSRYSPYSSSNTDGPVTLLSASRKDPFETLPVRMGQQEYELADYWISRLSYWSGPNTHMKERVFQAAMRHPVTFQAVILGYCARWKGQLSGNPQDQPLIQYYQTQVEQVINRPDSDSAGMNDEQLALTFTGLTLQEERFGDKQKAQQLSQQAIHIQQTRTIPVADNAARAFLFYVMCVMSPLSCAIPMDGTPWLLDLLHSGESLMRQHNTADYLAQVPQRATTFNFESPLYRLLASGPQPSQVPDDSRQFVVNKHIPTMEWSRTAALIYITMALWNYESSSNQTARFLDYLMHMVKEYSLDRHPACESFIFLLVEESCDPDLKAPDRSWSTVELLRIYKTLPPHLQFCLNEMLLGYLMLIPPLRSVDSFEKDLYDSIS